METALNSSCILIKNGQAFAEIVVDPSANNCVKIAAEDLRDHLELMSGVRLKIVDEPGEEKYPLFVGENCHTEKLGYKLPKFNSSGYDIFISDKFAVLSGPCMFFPEEKQWTEEEFHKFMGEKYDTRYFTSGNSNGYNKVLDIPLGDDVGPMHAVSAFLESLGVRFYAPGKDGTIIPEKKNIVLPFGRTTREAAFGRREYYFGKKLMHETSESLLWFKRLKCGNCIPIVCNHTLPALILNQENRVKHPNWYAEESPGKTYPGFFDQGGVPRYTDPDFQRAAIEWARKLFDTYPGLKQVTLGAPEDNGDPYDWRDRAIYEKPGISHKQAYANMMYDFHAAVARGIKETHPDKSVIWWCLYNNCVPTNIDYATHPDNLVCRVEAIPPSYYVQDKRCKEFFASIEALYQAFRPHSKSQQWEWWLDYNYDSSPRYPEFFMHRLQEVRQEERKYFDGFFMEIATDSRTNPTKLGEMPISHLMTYVNNKLMWDPDLDMDSLLEEYYRLWFGPAAQEMKAFHEYAEKIWCRDGSRSISQKEGFLKEEFVGEYFELLEKAKAKTVQGTLYFERIAAMEKAFAPLKNIFKDRTPQGEWIEAEILPADAVADGDLSKYKFAQTLLDKNARNRTETAIGMTEDKKFLFVAFKCYESAMDKVVENTKFFDRPSIFEDDYVQILLNTPTKNYFSILVNPAGAVWDESRDLEIINRDALAVLWTPGTQVHAEKFFDRWEVEIAVPTHDFGKTGPTINDPWGIALSRCRRAGGTKEFSAWSNVTETPSSWRRLWKKPHDFEGRLINSSNFIVNTVNPVVAPYIIKKASEKVDISAEWESPCWKNIPFAKLDCMLRRPGAKDIHTPETRVKLQYDSKFIYGLFQVEDCYVKAVAARDQEQVCRDSCVEFFIRPAYKVQYFNFEFSCGGKMLLYEIENWDKKVLTKVPVEELQKIERFHSLPEIVNPELTEPTVWRLGFKIPLELFVRRAGCSTELSGQCWHGNFFKCADNTSHPHWLTWYPSADFHAPDEFGKLIFE